MREIERSINSRVNGVLYPLDPTPLGGMHEHVEGRPMNDTDPKETKELITPVDSNTFVDDPASSTPLLSENPEPVSSNAPFLPANERHIPLPAMIIGQDIPTPSPTPKPRA